MSKHRPERMEIRISEDKKQYIRQAAKKRGMSVGDYLFLAHQEYCAASNNPARTIDVEHCAECGREFTNDLARVWPQGEQPPVCEDCYTKPESKEDDNVPPDVQNEFDKLKTMRDSMRSHVGS